MKHDFPNKIIFLDIDGVLSTQRNRYNLWDEEAMKNLEYILEETNASIVVSSSWRTDREPMIKSFKEHGCTDKIIEAIIGITIRGYHCVKKGSKLPICRGNEIKHWVDTRLKYPWHGDKKLNKVYSIYKEDGSFHMMDSNDLDKDYTYVILDDESDMLYEQRNHFIRTWPKYGITEENAWNAIRILKRV